MATVKLSEIRAKFPMYADLSDDQLLSGVRSKFYPDIPMAKFAGMIDYDTQREKLGKEIVGDMSTLDKVRAGAGKAFSDLGTGVAQLVGAGPSREEFDQTKRRDAALMDSGAAKAGNFGGTLAATLPAMFMPGANTLAGASLGGAALGLAGPVGTGDSRLANAAIGGAAGAGGVMAGRALQGLAQGGKALIDPFTSSGRDKIAGRVIQRFADDPAKVAAAQGGRTITGAVPTIAEETGDAGMARLQDALRALDPQIANRIGQRLSDNNAARIASLGKVAGVNGARDAAAEARDQVAKQLYGSAFANTSAVTPSQLKAQATLMQSGKIDQLLQAPAIQEAVKQAQTNAANAGKKMAPAGSIEGLHNVKLAIDDMIRDPQTAAQATKMAALRSARDRVVSVIETLSPDYKQARQTYSAMSQPVNSFDIGAEVLKRASSNTSDLAGNPRMQANALMGALRDEPALISRATGRKGVNALADVMQPDDLNLLRAVASESDRAAAVASAGAGPGSATAQRMASQNILQRLVGPTGLPDSWAESAIANTVVGKPLNLLYGGVAEPKIQQALADAVLDPVKARALLAAAQKQGLKLPDNATTRALMHSARMSSPAALLSVSEPGQR